ncbi:MAG: NUDIX hydrolase [Chloroflexota bacterium]
MSTDASLTPTRSRYLKAVRHRSAGAVVSRDGQVLILRKANGQWVFPKGHIEPDEQARAAAQREVLEESGVRARIGDFLGSTAYTFLSGSRELEHRKTVEWFTGQWLDGDPKPEEGLFEEARFVNPDEAAELLTFEEDRDILNQSLKRVPAP